MVVKNYFLGAGQFNEVLFEGFIGRRGQVRIEIWGAENKARVGLSKDVSPVLDQLPHELRLAAHRTPKKQAATTAGKAKIKGCS